MDLLLALDWEFWIALIGIVALLVIVALVVRWEKREQDSSTWNRDF